MKKLNIIIIGQWVYPILRPRSHRTWQLAINLSKMGHNVTVYALLGKSDYTEYEQKYGLKVKNLGKSWYGCLNSDGSPQPFITRLIGKFLGDYLQFPQIELKGMVKDVLGSIQDDVDLLITIGSPHTIHWGAASVMPKNNIKRWIADCGDPFMLNPFSAPPLKYEKEERNWCNKVDVITVPIEEAKNAYYEEYRHKIVVIPQGFDFSQAKLAIYKRNDIPTFAFSGAVYPEVRDPKNFMKYLSQINEDFKFVIYTKLQRHFEPYASKLADKIEFREYVPRDTLIYELSKMDFLVNVQNIGTVQQPSKLIDYAQAKRPILNITTAFLEEEKMTFNDFLRGIYTNAYKIDDINRFDIKNICTDFIKLAKAE